MHWCAASATASSIWAGEGLGRPHKLLGFRTRAARRRSAPLAQLDRASDYGSEGWGFESSRVRHPLPDAGVRNAGQVRHVALPGDEVACAEPAKIVVAAGAGEDLHQVDRGFEVVGQLTG